MFYKHAIVTIQDLAGLVDIDVWPFFQSQQPVSKLDEASN